MANVVFTEEVKAACAGRGKEVQLRLLDLAVAGDASAMIAYGYICTQGHLPNDLMPPSKDEQE